MGKHADTFDAFIEQSKTMVQMSGDAFTDPEDDWTPAAFYEYDTDKFGIAAIMPGVDITRAMVKIISEDRVSRISLVLSMWTLDAQIAAARGIGTRFAPDFATIPGRKECLIIHSWDAVEGERDVRADIERHEDGPPTLTPWRVLPEKTKVYAAIGEAIAANA